MTTETKQLLAKSFDVPDEGFPIGEVGRIDIIHLGDSTWGRATFQPGFRWTVHYKETAGTDLCEIPHLGYVVSGRAVIKMADGTERELAAGDLFDVPPGHDALDRRRRALCRRRPHRGEGFFIELGTTGSPRGARVS